MKEEKARTKWCPMFNNTSINARGGSSNNRKSFNTQTFTNECTCIASDCAVWVPHNIEGNEYGSCGLIKT